MRPSMQAYAAAPNSRNNSLGTRSGAQLDENRMQVDLYGTFRNTENPADHPVGISFFDPV